MLEDCGRSCAPRLRGQVVSLGADDYWETLDERVAEVLCSPAIDIQAPNEEWRKVTTGWHGYCGHAAEVAKIDKRYKAVF